jgi:hypothetical protein
MDQESSPHEVEVQAQDQDANHDLVTRKMESESDSEKKSEPKAEKEAKDEPNEQRHQPLIKLRSVSGMADGTQRIQCF